MSQDEVNLVDEYYITDLERTYIVHMPPPKVNYEGKFYSQEQIVKKINKLKELDRKSVV